MFDEKKRFKGLKRFIIVVLILQFLFTALNFIGFGTLNAMQVAVGTKAKYENIQQQEEVLKMPESWILFGPWKLGLIGMMEYSKNAIKKNGFKKPVKYTPLYETPHFLKFLEGKAK